MNRNEFKKKWHKANAELIRLQRQEGEITALRTETEKWKRTWNTMRQLASEKIAMIEPLPNTNQLLNLKKRYVDGNHSQ